MLLDGRYCRQELRPSGIMEYYYDCQGYVVWGVTARILKPFLDIVVAEGLVKPPKAAP